MSTQVYKALFFKILSSGAQIVFLLLTARLLGSEGRGELTLFLTNLTLLQLFSELLNGPALVYLSPRLNKSSMIGITLVWAVISNLAGLFILKTFLNIETLHPTELLLTSFALSLYSAWLMMIQGKEKLSWFWLISFLQPLIQLALIIILYTQGQLSVINTIYGIWISYSLALVLLLFPLSSIRNTEQVKDTKESLIQMFKHGVPALLANLAFFLSARTVVYMMEYADPSNKSIGIYSVAATMVEAMWIINLGLASWLYPRVANETDKTQQALISTQTFRMAVLLSLFPALIYLSVPNAVYIYILGDAYHSTYYIILLLLPGVFLLNGGKILWNYFTGTGLFKVNYLASMAGAIVAIALCRTLLPYYRTEYAAAIAVSAGYITTSAGLIVAYLYYSKTLVKELIPGKQDLQSIFVYVRNLRSN